ncbi:MAG: hypothetical protein KME14_20310 [Tildeniella torsiva UHER 1998/13D]|jgi:hypothetical protein|nr:hypothetical protein [Tildeniella torsiva UHER 1998/13D]
MTWVPLLRCKGAIAVVCTPIDGFIKVAILAIEKGDTDTAATLINTDDGARYPVLLPPAGVYYRVLLERLPDAPTV